MARQYFGTDGVRGVVGDSLTAELVERLGKAAALWCSGGSVFVGRDTRGSGPELEEALARGISAAGGTAVLAGVLPTPAVALLRLDLGAVISASHNPPEYNGVKLFDRLGSKLNDAAEEEIEKLLDEPPRAGGGVEHAEGSAEQYLALVLERFGSDLSGLRVAVDCANGAYAGLAPRAFEQLGADVTAIGDAPDGSNINVGCGATDLRALAETVRAGEFDLGVAFDGDGDRMLAVDETGEPLDGDQILAVLALDLGVETVAVTTMTNLGFHQLMQERGIRVVTTDVGDRYVLEALKREGALLGGEQSGHLLLLDGHVTGDGLVAALLLCRALRARNTTLSDAAAVMPRFPQVTQNLPRTGRGPLPESLLAQVAAVNEKLAGSGRVLVRPSGTEPVVRVLAEAESQEKAEKLCASLAALVIHELG
ncbi:MAG: phosphoglucosamine mutase [Gaiellaceae bacterium]